LILRPRSLSLGTVESSADGPVLCMVEYVDPAPGIAGGKAVVTVPLVNLAPDAASGRAGIDRPADAALAVFDEAFNPYAFGLQRYDPFESLAASLDRAVSTSLPLAMAVWAAMESDLFRFAYDGGFTSDLELIRQSDDWRRFARLNDLYRAVIKAIVPFGIVPRSWSAWLRDPDRSDLRNGRAADLGMRLLTRGIEAIRRGMLASASPGSILMLT